MTGLHGRPTFSLENDWVRLDVLTNALRIVRFHLKGHANLLAELAGPAIPTPYGDFHFYGGHRLWHAPEAMPRTYIPDRDLQVNLTANGIRLDRPAEPWTQIAKSLEIRLNPERPQVILQHELRNDGPWPIQLAPWALTMFRLGGVAIFPLPTDNADPEGLLPNRHFAFWPYSRLNDPRLILYDRVALVRAMPASPPFKFGYFNPFGWQAYLLEGVLFVKTFNPHPGLPFPDGGCNTESYCNDQFIELESLGPLQTLEPGQTALHVETWDLYDSLEHSPLPAEIQTLLNQERFL